MKGRKTGGRKKGTPNKSTAEIKEMIDKVSSELEKKGEGTGLTQVIRAMFQKAIGIAVEGEDEKIYTQPPDVGAARFLSETRFGKPKESIEVDPGDRALENDGGVIFAVPQFIKKGDKNHEDNESPAA